MSTTQNRSRLQTILFPDKPRDLPFRITIRIFFRSLHILAIGVLLGGHVFNQPISILEPWLWAAVITGSIILLTDLHSSFAVLFELRGIAILLKITMLLLIPVFWEQRVAILVVILFIGAISSHLPKRYRHRIFILKKDIHSNHRNSQIYKSYRYNCHQDSMREILLFRLLSNSEYCSSNLFQIFFLFNFSSVRIYSFFKLTLSSSDIPSSAIG